MEDQLKRRVLARASAYAILKGLSLATVSKKASGDARWLAGIKDGKGFTVARFDTVMDWFDKNWPAEAAAE